MKKRLLAAFLVATLTATALVGCGSDSGKSNDGKKSKGGKEVAIMVPSADHGWTGAVLTYAQEEAKKLSKDGKYEVNVYAATDVENQIQQVDDLLSNPDNLAGIVILPYDNGLQSTIEKIATADVPFVQFDRVIESDIINEKVVANVKGDNEGIGYETAKRFIADGLTKDDYVYEMIGDNSSVPELRSKGFRKYLTEQGWTDEEIDKEGDVTVHIDGEVQVVPAGTQVKLEPGMSITIMQGMYHDFEVEPGTGPVLIGEVSQCNDDNIDNRFNPPAGRFPEIEEDEPPYRLLCNEYPEASEK